jgi:MoaA/NifB/PqqE/SkfB family radical SAM enzyme
MAGNIKLYIKKTLINRLPKWVSHFARLTYLNLTANKRLAERKKIRFDVHLTDHCNLNCNGCLHFSPLSCKKYLAIESFEKDCKQLSRLTYGDADDICLLGGEPLLHPDITKFFPIIRQHFQKCRINILTNGILLPKQLVEFWESCSKNNIVITISYYPIDIDLVYIEDMARRYDIPLEIRDQYRGNNNTWLHQPLDIDGKQDGRKSHQTCAMANYCIQLVDGKIYQCETSAYIHHFNRYFDKNLLVGKDDYIDIYEVTDISQVLQFLCQPIPFCRYCKTKEIKYVNWGYSRKSIEEWI